MASGSLLEAKSHLSGPEKPTLIERFISLVRLPYFAGCLLVTAIFGTGPLLFLLADTRSFSEAFRVLVSLYPDYTPLWQIFLVQALAAATLFLIFNLIRYMRIKLVATEPKILSLCPQGEETLHRIFRRVSSIVPPVILCIPLAFFPLSSIAFGLLPGSGVDPVPSPGIFSLVGAAGGFFLLFFAISTFLWMYFSSIFGLHKLGKIIGLKSYYEDAMLGVRPIGSLSLSLAFAYFLGLGAFLLLLSLNAPIDTSILFGTVLVLLGLSMFFLPLYSLHKRMLAQKQLEKTMARTKFMQLLDKPDNPVEEHTQTSLEDLRSLFRIEMVKTELSNLPTWPFDISILGKLIAIVLSLTAILLSRVFARILGI